MVSFELGRTLKAAARILVLAAVAGPCSGVSQPELSPFFDDDVLAAEAVERALDVVRVTYGIHSLEQAPLIRQAIQIQAARGDPAAAWDLEQELLTLVGRHPDDLRTVPILREIADKRMDVFRRYVAGDLPPEIILGCYYKTTNVVFRSCTSGSKRVAARSVLLEAWKHYDDAIAVILRNELYSSDELRELEMEIIRGNYLYGDILPAPSRYERGEQRLRRLLAYDDENAEARLSQVGARVRIADWELMYSHNGLALEMYEQAYEELKREGIAQASIEQIFSPETPVVLPTFLPNPLVSGETPESSGYIDVAFEVTRNGRSRQIEVLDTTVNATRASKADLVQLISRSRFRPRLTDGGFARSSPVIVRYYLNE